MREEIHRLRVQVRNLMVERDILKNAIASGDGAGKSDIGKFSDLTRDPAFLSKAVEMYYKMGDKLCKSCLTAHADAAAAKREVEEEPEKEEAAHDELKRRTTKARAKCRKKLIQYKEKAKTHAQTLNRQKQTLHE